MNLEPIGFARSSQRLHHDAPRQPVRAGTDIVAGQIELLQGYQNMLRDLAGFSHIWILFWCHLTRGHKDLVEPPRGGGKRGLLATRAPNRPNSIGLSAVRLLRIEKRVLHIGSHDLLDGTPVLDIKPYLVDYDSIPDATRGWLGTVPDGPEHKTWWQEKGVEPPQVYRR